MHRTIYKRLVQYEAIKALIDQSRLRDAIYFIVFATKHPSTTYNGEDFFFSPT